MKDWMKYGLVGIISISMLMNILLFIQYHQQRQKLNEVETFVVSSIERNIRQSMRQIDFLLKEESPESLQKLQGSMIEMTLALQQWVLMNQTEESPNELLQVSLSAMESLRNTMVNHLELQYRLQLQELTEPDREMLSTVYQQLARMLLIHHNIQNRVDELKDPQVNDGGMRPLVDQIQETTLLYRHSMTPNRHPAYLEPSEAQARGNYFLPFVEGVELFYDAAEVSIQEGVHVYHMKMALRKGSALIAVDAQLGEIREFQLTEAPEGEASYTLEMAFDQARNIVLQLHDGGMNSEYLPNPSNSEPQMYHFRFTPVSEAGLNLEANAYYLTISAVDGSLLYYSQDFSEQSMPEPVLRIPMEIIRQEQQLHYGRMHYDGISILRRFSTRYEPRSVYRFRALIAGQPTILYFDTEKGRLIDEVYDRYEPIEFQDPESQPVTG